MFELDISTSSFLLYLSLISQNFNDYNPRLFLFSIPRFVNAKGKHWQCTCAFEK